MCTGVSLGHWCSTELVLIQRGRGGVRVYGFFFKQKTAYEMRSSDWSSDVCSSDLELVQALGLSFTVSTVALAAGLAGSGVFEVSLAGTSALALAPALVGMALGQRVRVRVRPQVFRLCFFLGMLGLGGHLALRALF